MPATQVRTFVNLTFAAAGVPPSKVIERLQRIQHLSFVKGSHDLLFRWETPAEFWERVAYIHQALHGTGATYRFETTDDEGVVPEASPWIGALPDDVEENPAIRRRQASLPRRDGSPAADRPGS